MEITEEVECLLHGYDACRRGSRSPRAEVVVSVERPGSGPARPSFLRARSRLLDRAVPTKMEALYKCLEWGLLT